MGTFKLAWRNVWRNKRRTLATVSAMTLALTIMIMYSGVVSGYLSKMENSILELEVGDIQIFAGDYRENPSLYTRIKNPEKLLASLEKAGFKASGRLLGNGLAAAGDSSSGAILRGIDPKRNGDVSLIGEQVMEGKWLDRSDETGVVIGKRLAKSLDVKPGDEIIILTQGADGSTANELYIVRGILKSVGDQTDRAGVFMLDTAYKELMVVSEGVHQIIVRSPDGVELDAAAVKAKTLAPGLDVKTWREIMPTMANMMESTSSMIYTMFLIVYIAIGILILNAMLMAVFERIREFGVLKALGMGPSKVLRLILAESALQTSVAMCMGILIAIPGNYYLSTYGINLSGLSDLSIGGIAWNSILMSKVDTNTYLGPIITLLFIVSIAVLYPALKAALIKPVSAIYHR